MRRAAVFAVGESLRLEAGAGWLELEMLSGERRDGTRIAISERFTVYELPALLETVLQAAREAVLRALEEEKEGGSRRELEGILKAIDAMLQACK